MYKYKHILFDMDGTLIDSQRGIIESAKIALEKLGIIETDTEKLKTFIGPPLKNTFISEYGMNNSLADMAVNIFRENYSEEGIFNADLYSGVEDVLALLRDRGYSLYIATSKPQKFAVAIAEKFKIKKYFKQIVGSNLDNTRSRKSEVLQFIISSNNLSVSELLMVGDKAQDIIGARECGIAAIGVLYGYGSKEELKNENPLKIISSLTELPEVLMTI